MREKIFELLNNAVENGYDLSGWDARQLADDLGDYAPDMEGRADEALPHIQAWLESDHPKVRASDGDELA